MRNGKLFVLITMVIGIAILIGSISSAQEITDQQAQDLFAQGQTTAPNKLTSAALSPAVPMTAAIEPMALVVGAGSWANGYSGGCGGAEFQDSIPANTKEVAGVIVRSGAYVDSLQMAVRLTTGNIKLLNKHGGNGGAQSVFRLNNGEYITSMWGRYGSYVDSIQFGTSTGRSSPKYGGNGGCGNFYYSAPAGYEIAGFYGRSGAYIDAIGVVLKKH